MDVTDGRDGREGGVAEEQADRRRSLKGGGGGGEWRRAAEVGGGEDCRGGKRRRGGGNKTGGLLIEISVDLAANRLRGGDARVSQCLLYSFEFNWPQLFVGWGWNPGAEGDGVSAWFPHPQVDARGQTFTDRKVTLR